MEWVIESYDRKTDREEVARIASLQKSAFIGAAEDLLRNVRMGFAITATLPDGTRIVRDEQGAAGS